MPSLREYIGTHTESLLEATQRAYAAALTAVGRSARRAVPGIETDLSTALTRLRDQLQADPSPSATEKTQRGIENELSLWADNVQQHLKSKAVEAREIMLVMARAAQSITGRDQRYLQRFRELTSQLEGIADLDDLSEVRRCLIISAQELKVDIGGMEKEGKATIAGLEDKLESYRKQLAEAERRECIDPLTGLLNRRGIETAMEKRREYGRPFCVILLDLNSFKPVNDTYGHAAGDDLLKQFSAELHTHFRPTDLIGRWGGDEFIIVFNDDLQHAQSCIESLRKWAFGSYKVTCAKGTCPVLLSAATGVAVWDPHETITELLRRADAESVYENKRANAREA